MPARSQKQRAYLYSRFGDKWVHQHHFDNKGKLPTYVKPVRANPKRKG
jgi:hypothetical protein